jgi:UDP-glucuronate 4-epimerase
MAMKILVTGAAGFIGYHICLNLASNGFEVYGIDNINDYYNPKLKFDRLKELGFDIKETENFNKEVQSFKFNNLKFSRIDLVDKLNIDKLFEKQQFDLVCNLAAQAGVRYSIDNPKAYIDSNVVGFLNILEGCKHQKVKHLVYASSSSVYGENKKVPFDPSQNVDRPISLYAATKKSNELMAHAYGHLNGFHTTGLRFFTVYGPWGRPDMAYYRFTDSIYKGMPILVYNNGKMERDFTYIDDIVNGIIKIIEKRLDNREHYKIYNIGNHKSEKLVDFIIEIENFLGKKAIKKLLPMQPGDVTKTYANIDEITMDYGFIPKTSIKEGLKNFTNWYINYNKLNYEEK